MRPFLASFLQEIVGWQSSRHASWTLVVIPKPSTVSTWNIPSLLSIQPSVFVQKLFKEWNKHPQTIPSPTLICDCSLGKKSQKTYSYQMVFFFHGDFHPIVKNKPEKTNANPSWGNRCFGPFRPQMFSLKTRQRISRKLLPQIPGPMMVLHPSTRLGSFSPTLQLGVSGQGLLPDDLWGCLAGWEMVFLITEEKWYRAVDSMEGWQHWQKRNIPNEHCPHLLYRFGKNINLGKPLKRIHFLI